jgi:catechol 2,3-dioxygenase-like lactoylglutathione lyase family enzyme
MLGAERLTHWSMPVKNLEESEHFYRDFLGIEFLGRLGNGRASCYRVGDTSFIQWETGKETDPAIRDSGVHYAFTLSPDTWDRAVHEIHDRGVPLRGPIVYREQGFFLGREIYFWDPSGNAVELTDPTWKPGMPTPSYEEIIGG